MIYSRELKKYNKSYLKSELFLDDNTIQELLDKRILTKTEEDMFCFKFVGILIIKERVLFCLPKYAKNSGEKTVAKQLLELFGEYSKRENLDVDELESIGSIDSKNSYNMLSVILFLLNDYFENGLYSNEKSIYIFNGDEEIDWLKTIDEVQPLINEGELVYLEYYTNSTQSDEENYFRQLHSYILNKCTKKLNYLGLFEFLGFKPIYFEVDEERLGNTESIIYRINNELNVQFINRKQLLLKAMSSFISNEEMEIDNFTISFYGTRSFHVIWEKTCGYVLNNKYEAVKKLIAPPKWTTLSGKVHKASTLIPDIISITKDSFVISDAKYYSIKLTEDILSGKPGVEDVTKQYLYQLAFDKYIKSKKFACVKNIFLFPSQEKEMKQLGKVTIEFLKDLDLEDITLFSVPAHKVFDLYTNSKKLNIEKFLNLKIELIK
ncbi:LlaJI family restriction endonuclease [Clostridium bowmanii]|uniref:LlaJI family restriction endonuclease n=1 Tax=Clostridium bowmanii TaxID=132925 RepID=UPI001C0C27C8|nr:LlaJI family restriction endonuclease [Clostridium bowmanii]MBU3191410.1 LlaJI family restriction endonuclease [Clostridium bowmanii]MCA1075745.1 LlaJI family restriction endonuclease [Clostridium bowmanii]